MDTICAARLRHKLENVYKETLPTMYFDKIKDLPDISNYKQIVTALTDVPFIVTSSVGWRLPHGWNNTQPVYHTYLMWDKMLELLYPNVTCREQFLEHVRPEETFKKYKDLKMINDNNDNGLLPDTLFAGIYTFYALTIMYKRSDPTIKEWITVMRYLESNYLDTVSSVRKEYENDPEAVNFLDHLHDLWC